VQKNRNEFTGIKNAGNEHSFQLGLVVVKTGWLEVKHYEQTIDYIREL
jgi:hypothetical protein